MIEQPPEELRRAGNVAYFLTGTVEWRERQRATCVDRVLMSVPDGWTKIKGRWASTAPDGPVASEPTAPGVQKGLNTMPLAQTDAAPRLGHSGDEED